MEQLNEYSKKEVNKNVKDIISKVSDEVEVLNNARNEAKERIIDLEEQFGIENTEIDKYKIDNEMANQLDFTDNDKKYNPQPSPAPPPPPHPFPFLKRRLTQKVTDFCSMISLQLNDITKFFVLYNGTIALQIFTHCFTYLF